MPNINDTHTLPEGDCIVWKLCKHNNIYVYVKIMAYNTAKRVTTNHRNKARIDHGMVLDIIDEYGKHYDRATSCVYINDFVYEKGKMVYADSFDSNPYNDCGHGISVHKHRNQCDQWKTN